MSCGMYVCLVRCMSVCYEGASGILSSVFCYEPCQSRLGISRYVGMTMWQELPWAKLRAEDRANTEVDVDT